MNKKIVIIGIGVFILLLPFGGIFVAWKQWGKVVYDNPDFWYGYMAYFGTVSLAVVSLIQNVNAKEINDRFMMQQLRQKLGYFNLKEESTNGRKYRKIQVGQFTDGYGNEDPSKDKNLGIWLVNVGEDMILNVHTLYGKINGMLVEVPCSINVIYKNEEICFELDNKQYFQAENLKIEFLIQMKNSAGILYKQYFCVGAKKSNNNRRGMYLITEYDTNIEYLDKK